MKGTRYKLGFAIIAGLMLLTALGAPVAAQSSVREGNLVHYEHEGHCHLVSDCEATSFVGHAGPTVPDGIAITVAGQFSQPISLEDSSFSSVSDPVPTPPPIA